MYSTSSKVFIGFLLLINVNLMVAEKVFSQTFSSGNQQVPLIELYTSEGCSSCPPADKYLSRLENSESLWKKFVPVAFHVDYWDYIGWKDPYADKKHAFRQRQYRREGNTKGVYTPGFVFMGNEWRTWYYNLSIPEVNWPDVGDLQVSLKDGVASVSYTPASNSEEKLQVHLVVLGFDLKSRVKRGENKGKTLNHHFVNLAQTKQTSQKTNGKFTWQLAVPNKLKATAKRKAIAVWVSALDRQQPIQSTGAWME